MREQAFSWRNVAIATSSRRFAYIPGLELRTCGRGGATVTASGHYTGGRLDIRVVQGNRVLLPGAAHFEAAPPSYLFLVHLRAGLQARLGEAVRSPMEISERGGGCPRAWAHNGPLQ